MHFTDCEYWTTRNDVVIIIIIINIERLCSSGFPCKYNGVDDENFIHLHFRINVPFGTRKRALPPRRFVQLSRVRLVDYTTLTVFVFIFISSKSH